MPSPFRAPRIIHRGAVHPAVFVMPTVAVILSFVMTWATLGFGPEFLARWLRGFSTTILVLPFAFASLGHLDRLVNKAIGRVHWTARKVAVAAIAACVVESVTSFALTAMGHGFDASFKDLWWLAFSRALPVGLTIGLFMAFYMKPKMDRMWQAALARSVG